MEIALAIFICVWLVAASVISYIWLKKDFSPFINNEIESNIDDENTNSQSENSSKVDEKKEQQHE